MEEKGGNRAQLANLFSVYKEGRLIAGSADPTKEGEHP